MVIIIQNWSENPRMKLLAVLWKNARANFLACHSKLLRFCPIAMLQNVTMILYNKVRILVPTSVIRPETFWCRPHCRWLCWHFSELHLLFCEFYLFLFICSREKLRTIPWTVINVITFVNYCYETVVCNCCRCWRFT